MTAATSIYLAMSILSRIRGKSLVILGTLRPHRVGPRPRTSVSPTRCVQSLTYNSPFASPLCINNRTRTPTQVTSPKLALVLRKYEPLKWSSLLGLTRCIVVLASRPQTLGLVVDTGSSDLWFATSNCIGCQGTRSLDTTRSSSITVSNTPVTMSYGSGDAAGLLATDTVSLGPYTV